MSNKNKKGLATLKEAMIGITIIVFVASGLLMFNADISTNYGYNYTNYGGINDTTAINELTQNVYDDIQGASETPFGAAYYAIKGGWDSFKLLFQMMNIGTAVYTNVTDVTSTTGVPIPTFVSGLIIVMLTLIIIFAALSYIGKVNM